MVESILSLMAPTEMLAMIIPVMTSENNVPTCPDVKFIPLKCAGKCCIIPPPKAERKMPMNRI